MWDIYLFFIFISKKWFDFIYVWIIVNLNLIFYSFLFYVYNISFEKKRIVSIRKTLNQRHWKTLNILKNRYRCLFQ